MTGTQATNHSINKGVNLLTNMPVKNEANSAKTQNLRRLKALLCSQNHSTDSQSSTDVLLL